MPTKLKPCPFCPYGGDPYMDTNVYKLEADYGISARIGCRQCGVGFDLFGYTPAGRDPQKEADALLPPLVEKWNRRPVTQGEVEFAIQYFDGARWELEWGPDSAEEPTRGYMEYLAAQYPAVKYRLVSRQIGDWEPMDKEGGQP